MCCQAWECQNFVCTVDPGEMHPLSYKTLSVHPALFRVSNSLPVAEDSLNRPVILLLQEVHFDETIDL